MSVRTGIFVSLLLPILVRTIPNPIGVMWVARHGDRSMPQDVLKRALAMSNAIAFLQLLLLGVVLWMLGGRATLEGAVRSQQSYWWTATLGVIVGSGWVMLYAFILALVVPSKMHFGRNRFVQQSLTFSMALAVCSPPVEEFWRAFCLISLAPLGNAAALVMSALAFGFAHSASLGRAVSMVAFGLYLGGIFLLTQSLLTLVVAHEVVNVGTLWLVRATYARARET